MTEQHFGAVGPVPHAPWHGVPVVPQPDAFDATQLMDEDWATVRNMLAELQAGAHLPGGSELLGQRPDGFALSTIKAPLSGHAGIMESRDGAVQSVLLRCGETGRVFLLATAEAEQALDPVSNQLLRDISAAVCHAPGMVELSLVQSHLATLRQLGEDVLHVSGGQITLAALLKAAGDAEMQEPGWGGVRTIEEHPFVQEARLRRPQADLASHGAILHAVRAAMTLTASPAHIFCADEDRQMIGRLTRTWPREVPPASQGSPCESLGRFASWLGQMGHGSLRSWTAPAGIADLEQRAAQFDALKRHYAYSNLLSEQDMGLLEAGLTELAYDPCQLPVENWKAAMAVRSALDASLARGDAQVLQLGERPDGFGLQAYQAPHQWPVFLEVQNGQPQSMLLKSAETGQVFLLVRRDAEEGLDAVSNAMLRHFQAAACGVEAMVEMGALQGHLALLRSFGKALPGIQRDLALAANLAPRFGGALPEAPSDLTLGAVLFQATQAERAQPGQGAIGYIMKHPARTTYLMSVPEAQRETINAALGDAVRAFTTLGLPGEAELLADEDRLLIGRLAKVLPREVPPAGSGSPCESLGRFAAWLGQTASGTLQSWTAPRPNESDAEAWQRMVALNGLKGQWLNSGAAVRADLALVEVGLERLREFYATGRAFAA